MFPHDCLRLSEGGLDGSGAGECRLIRKHYGTSELLTDPAIANIKTRKNCLPAIRKHSIRKVIVHSTVVCLSAVDLLTQIGNRHIAAPETAQHNPPSLLGAIPAPPSDGQQSI
jgi:hypothetical protein